MDVNCSLAGVKSRTTDMNSRKMSYIGVINHLYKQINIRNDTYTSIIQDPKYKIKQPMIDQKDLTIGYYNSNNYY